MGRWGEMSQGWLGGVKVIIGVRWGERSQGWLDGMKGVRGG